MTLFERLTQQAKANKQRIVLAEGAEKRTLTAADHLIADGICDITLIGNPAEIKQLAAELSLKTLSMPQSSTLPTRRLLRNMHSSTMSCAKPRA